MSSTIAIPEGFQYVGAALLSATWVALGQSFVVSSYRKRAGIKYPQLYAEKAQADASKDAYLFNCAQRAHQNTLENLPLIFAMTIIAGVRYPVLAAAACAYWSFARISYTRGYITGDPAKRASILYRISYLPQIGLLLTSAYMAGEWVFSGLSKLF